MRANGYGRSEAVSVVLLQKAKHAKRIYAELIYTKTNCDGYKEQGITFPACEIQKQLLTDFYNECNISPDKLAFLEAHGTGTAIGDPEELNAIDKVLCQNRTTPLKIGTIKSNIGHSEPASGVCSIAKVIISLLLFPPSKFLYTVKYIIIDYLETRDILNIARNRRREKELFFTLFKVIIAMESGIIPPNINFTSPMKGVKCIEEGRVKVITEPTPWEGGYVGINSFGFGGANGHALLKSYAKEKVRNGAPSDDLPRLVVVSGRTEEALEVLLGHVREFV